MGGGGGRAAGAEVLGVAADALWRGLLAAQAGSRGCREGGDLVFERAQCSPVGRLRDGGLRCRCGGQVGAQAAQQVKVGGCVVSAWRGALFPGLDGGFAHAAGVCHLVERELGFFTQSASFGRLGKTGGVPSGVRDRVEVEQCVHACVNSPLLLAGW